MDLFTVLFYQPIYNLIVVLYRFFGGDLGLAIITIALLSRFILLPLALRQAKMMSTNQEFSKKTKEIKEKHKNDKQKQQEELMKLQSEYLPGQLAGCLPLIIQFILLININNVFYNIFSKGIQSFSEVAYSFVPSFPQGTELNTSFLGLIDLNIHPNTIPFTAAIIPYLVIILLVGITQYLSIKIAQPANSEKLGDKDGKSNNKKNRLDKKSAEKPEDFSEILAQSTKQTMFLLPVMISLFSFNFAAGLSLYWIVQNSFVIIQQFFFNKYKLNKKN
jgi:YidC/Oxa1 family membrane protein insertase